MYLTSQLGRFETPAPGMWAANPNHPVLDVRYIAEPPLAVKGAMNPWELERTRQVFMAEEKAWKKVSALQAEYRRVNAQGDRLVKIFQVMAKQLEEMTGQPNKFTSISNIAEMIAGAGGNPYIMAALFLKKVVTMVFDMLKAKRIKRHVAKMEQVQKQIIAIYKRMEKIVQVVQYEIGVGERVRVGQQAIVNAVMEKSAMAYYTRASLDAQRANVIAEQARQAALVHPYTYGANYNAL